MGIMSCIFLPHLKTCSTLVGYSGDCWVGCFKIFCFPPLEMTSTTPPYTETTKLKGRDHIFNNNCLLNIFKLQSHIKIMYFILEINRTYPIPHHGLYWTTIGITGILVVTLPQYNMGYNFPPGLSHSHYRLCFAFRHILGITGRPFLQ